MSWFLRKRIPQIEYMYENPSEIQMDIFYELLTALKFTEFGDKYGANEILSYETFKKRIPLQTYEDIKSDIQRMMKGEQKILWPEPVNWFAKSSGTTADQSKFIPVSFDTMEDCQFKGSRDILAFYYHQNPEAKLFFGKGLIVGGSHEISEANEEIFYGDLSAVMLNNMPFIANLYSSLPMEVALMDNWEEKLDTIVEVTKDLDITNISGVPTWTLLILQKVLAAKSASCISEVWPNLELYVHGGVSFKPYKKQFNQLFKNKVLNYRETYNASEGFFGVQDEEGNDMLLMMDYGIFYEFIPMDTFHSDHPKVLWIDEVELHTNYALVITTQSGLWRYLIGDTIQFTSKYPHRIQITGRTKLFINAFGEELMIDNAEQALAKAQSECDCIIKEYTAAPIYIADKEKGGHEWWIEFTQQPKDMEYFIQVLDETLKTLNSDYQAKRYGDLAVMKPKIINCPTDTFYKWMKDKNKLGGQHKVPRLCNDRKFVDELGKYL